MRIKAIAFDMDGTLYSSEPILAKVYHESVQELNTQEKTHFVSPRFEEMEPLIGLPVRDIYLALFPGISEAQMEAFGKIIARTFRRIIAQEGGALLGPIKEIFEELEDRGYLLLIASNGTLAYLESVVQKYQLRVEPIICIQEHNGINNKTEILEAYLRHYKLDAKEMLMVGDRKSDRDAAFNVGSL
ncbi:MAG: hypothetical protein CVV50_06185, partial [Spirochaetae bacterium HGW-Spirochaetae-6]